MNCVYSSTSNKRTAPDRYARLFLYLFHASSVWLVPLDDVSADDNILGSSQYHCMDEEPAFSITLSATHLPGDVHTLVALLDA